MAPMLVIARRVAWLLLFALAAAAAVTWIRGRRAPQLGEAPEWPPLAPVGRSREEASTDRGPAADQAPTDGPAGEAGTWVDAPADGEVPEGFPVKVNTKSGVFHVPGGRFYDRTNAQRFYATADQALADGYRRSKS